MFVNEIKGIKFDPRDILISFNVVSLYTCIPIKEAIVVINHLTDHETTRLVEICLTSIFFYFEGAFYEQTYGVAMGSPLSLVVANIFMEYIESKASASAHLLPKLWKGFVDDKLVSYGPMAKMDYISFSNISTTNPIL